MIKSRVDIIRDVCDSEAGDSIIHKEARPLSKKGRFLDASHKTTRTPLFHAPSKIFLYSISIYSLSEGYKR